MFATSMGGRFRGDDTGARSQVGTSSVESKSERREDDGGRGVSGGASRADSGSGSGNACGVAKVSGTGARSRLPPEPLGSVMRGEGLKSAAKVEESAPESSAADIGVGAGAGRGISSVLGMGS